VQVLPNHFIGDFTMWQILEIGEKMAVGDERYWPKDMAWSSVNESCIGSQVVRTDHVVRRKISDTAESAKPTHNSAIVQFTAEQLYGAAKEAGLHKADIDDLISVIGKQHQ
jgi:hypothetical protein